jgi:hypothetical protein
LVKGETHKNGDSTDYDDISFEILSKVVTEGLKMEASETMAVMGYNVIAEGGWVVKIFADGSR